MQESSRANRSATLPEVTRLIQQFREKKTGAEEQLLGRVRYRLEQLAHQVLGLNPRIARWQQTGDLFNELWMKLRAALLASPIQDRRHFFHLASLNMNRLLCDLARKYRGPEAFEKNKTTNLPAKSSHDMPWDGGPASQPGPRTLASIQEDRARIHFLIEQLPVEDIELIGLVYYQELTQQEAAETLGVDVRTVRRRLARIHSWAAQEYGWRQSAGQGR